MAARKRVAHVLGASRGGLRRHVRYIAEHPPIGYETLGVWGPADLAEYFAGLPFHNARAGAMFWPESQADLVHAHGFGAGLVALRRKRPPVVITAHTDLTTQGRTARSRVLRALARLSARRADRVIAVSRRAGSHFPGAVIVPPAVEPLGPARRPRADVRAELGTPADRVVVVTVARLHADKGLDLFVEAVDRSGAEGWICGDGPLRERIGRLADGTSVRLLGYRNDVADILGAADMFALPSVGEAYGIAVVEAIAAGLPVVVSDAGAMPEIADRAGIVVNPGDRGAFERAVSSLVGNDRERKALAVLARKRGGPDNEDLVRRVGLVYDEVTA
ncbi:MAG TPA: glycosyltransferase family 4 protein [Actinomycetota bacterium]|jgi:glycosyltransferase involved in cell wall biosynthesis|nr:glycosyltransferase family 4 protein [Actinomycetota bacterium]